MRSLMGKQTAHAKDVYSSRKHELMTRNFKVFRNLYDSRVNYYIKFAQRVLSSLRFYVVTQEIMTKPTGNFLWGSTLYCEIFAREK